MGWANRTLCVLMALLLLPLAATAAPSPILEDPQALTEALHLFVRNAPGRKQGARVGDWFLHPMGFGFAIPDGFSVKPRQPDKTVTLVENAGGGSAFRANISIVVAEHDARLDTMTDKSIKEMYKGEFSRFELISLTRETMYDVPVVCLSFYSGSAPRLFLCQRVFVKNGHSFIITLTAENSIKTLPNALARYESLCASLLFLKDDR